MAPGCLAARVLIAQWFENPAFSFGHFGVGGGGTEEDTEVVVGAVLGAGAGAGAGSGVGKFSSSMIARLCPDGPAAVG